MGTRAARVVGTDGGFNAGRFERTLSQVGLDVVHERPHGHEIVISHRRILLLRRLLAASVLVGAATVTTSSQVFRGGVDVITVDVTVLDKDGRPVEELKPGDFTVKIDGQTRRVVSAVLQKAGAASPQAVLAPERFFSTNSTPVIGRKVMFAIDQLPTGDRDPFALRRHALGVLRILTERLPQVGLDRAVDAAIAAPAWPAAAAVATATVNGAAAPVRAPLLAFFADRLAASLGDRGYAATETAAVLADDKFFQLGEIEPRLLALRQFAALPEAAALAAANKRVGNILKKSGAPVRAAVDASLLREPAEAALDAALREVGPRAEAALAGRDYAGSLRALAALRTPVDAFFDGVMVNVDDAALRDNRLALLGRLHAAMNRVADLSRLAG